MVPAWEVKISFIGTMLEPPVVPGCAMLHVLQHVSYVRAARLYAVPPSMDEVLPHVRAVAPQTGGRCNGNGPHSQPDVEVEPCGTCEAKLFGCQ